MSGPESINPGNNGINYSLQQQLTEGPQAQKSGKQAQTADGQQLSAIKRPLRVDNSNNIFYINHKGENKTVRVEPGEYNLVELQNAIQDKVNERFGIGKVTLNLNGSGSDRLIQAMDSNIFDFLV